MNVLLAFGSPGWMEMLIVGVIAVLLFGSRLPEVGRSLGRGLTEFKKGMKGIKDEVEEATAERPPRPAPSNAAPRRAIAPKFEPPRSPAQAAPRPSDSARDPFGASDAEQLKSLDEVKQSQTTR